MMVHSAAVSRGLRACLVAAYRPEDAGAGTALAAVMPELRRLSTVVVLTPLCRDDVAASASQVAGAARIDGEILEGLVEATGSNPLSVSEVVCQFGGQVLPALEGLTSSPSPAIAAMAAERVARLSGTSREVLAAASAMGSRRCSCAAETSGPAVTAR